MFEGTPIVPGSIPGAAEGIAAQAARSDARTHLRLIRGGASRANAPVAELRRAVPPSRARTTLPGVALASATGVTAATLWCAALAFLGLALRSHLGDEGAFASVLAIQLGATLALLAWLRSRATIRAAPSREGTISSRC